jgi:hypothetical protein
MVRFVGSLTMRELDNVECKAVMNPRGAAEAPARVTHTAWAR